LCRNLLLLRQENRRAKIDLLGHGLSVDVAHQPSQQWPAQLTISF
jgi:hypothetical protein